MSRYEEEKGYPPYHPAMMVKVLLYAYCIGVPYLSQNGEAAGGGYRLPRPCSQQHS